MEGLCFLNENVINPPLLQRQGLSLDAVFASTAVRAKETAQIVCSTLGAIVDGEEIPISDQLEELSQGTSSDNFCL